MRKSRPIAVVHRETNPLTVVRVISLPYNYLNVLLSASQPDGHTFPQSEVRRRASIRRARRWKTKTRVILYTHRKGGLLLWCINRHTLWRRSESKEDARWFMMVKCCTRAERTGPCCLLHTAVLDDDDVWQSRRTNGLVTKKSCFLFREKSWKNPTGGAENVAQKFFFFLIFFWQNV
jgi:hypothetical protein